MTARSIRQEGKKYETADFTDNIKSDKMTLGDYRGVLSVIGIERIGITHLTQSLNGFLAAFGDLYL